jgi:vancomycin resistance protein YoaR
VVNIKRIAELTQGALIEPGKTFSINDFVGKRTVEKGFVSGGVIQDGVFQEDVGGGISQYATTLFNAAFFGGLDFAKYQSHSIYITRYPYGREATVSFPAPDLEITNSTPYAVLIWPTATNTSITVQLYSTVFATGAQTNQSEKPVGTSCTRVTTERTRTYADGRAPKVDSVAALYQREGIDCNGNPTAGATTTTTTTTTPPLITTTTAAPPSPSTTAPSRPTTTVAGLASGP